MSFDDWLGLVSAILLAAYLLYVLIAPERF
jgi:K+-transporting ATPase KdpF subunit